MSPTAEKYISSLLLLFGIADLIKAPKHPHVVCEPSKPSPKRKRRRTEREIEYPSPVTQDQPPSKRVRVEPSRCATEKELYLEAATNSTGDSPIPIQHWIQTGKWRKEYFEQDSQVRQDFERGKLLAVPGQRNPLQEHYTGKPFQAMHPFTHLHQVFVRKKSSTSSRRKQLQSSHQTSSDQSSRESKSSQYNSPDYELRLEEKGSFMRKSILGITDASQELCQTLLEKEQTIPQGTLFRDDLFDETCENVQGRNEAMIVRDITPLICPSAQNLRTYGARHLNNLYETINEGWNSTVEYEGALPQPDYSVGFGRFAFTQEQLSKLKPFVGELGSRVSTYLMATTRMYFPFLTCEA